jgi:hypothetical protein
MAANVIQANCRVQFTAEDIDFVVATLGRRLGDAECLARLLADEETRDLVLDDEALFRGLLEQRGCLRVSARFYFYVLVRTILVRAGLSDRRVADYVAEVMAEFSVAERVRCVVPGRPEPLDYFFEMLAALQTADDYARFVVRAHIANHALFLCGMFPDRIRHRCESRGFPSLRYYEELGRSNYRLASDHRLARRYELAPIFNVLADRFQQARQALNDLTDRLLSLADPPVPAVRLIPLSPSAGE